MSDRVAITPGSGDFVLTDQVTDGTLGQGQVQVVKVFDGTLDSTNKWKIESDGAARYVGDAAATATVTRVASSATVVTLIASNASRRGLFIYAEAATATLYVKFGSAATNTSYTVALPPGAYFEMPARPIYTGIVTGIWSSVDGAAQVTEI